MRHPIALLRVTFAALPLLALAACGPSEQEKRLKALAGTYVHDTEIRSAPDAGGMFVREHRALTLKADGTWRLVRTIEVNGMMQYTASGDTLWERNARMAKLADAAGLGVKVEDNFLVRER